MLLFKYCGFVREDKILEDVILTYIPDSENLEGDRNV